MNTTNDVLSVDTGQKEKIKMKREIRSMALSAEAVGKVDEVAARMGMSRSMVMERLLMNISSTTITRASRKTPIYSAAPEGVENGTDYNNGVQPSAEGGRATD